MQKNRYFYHASSLDHWNKSAIYHMLVLFVQIILSGMNTTQSNYNVRIFNCYKLGLHRLKTLTSCSNLVKKGSKSKLLNQNSKKKKKWFSVELKRRYVYTIMKKKHAHVQQHQLPYVQIHKFRSEKLVLQAKSILDSRH